MHDQVIRTAAVTPERWSDLVSLFGDRGACGGWGGMGGGFGGGGG